MLREALGALLLLACLFLVAVFGPFVVLAFRITSARHKGSK